MEIHKKILPESFERILSGKKKFELRLADDDLAGVQPGDTLVLDEYTSLDKAIRQPTGRSIKKEITEVNRFTLEDFYKLSPKEEVEKKGLVIFSLKD